MPLSILRRAAIRGTTMVEAIFLITIVSIVAVAVGVSMQALAAGPHLNDEQQSITAELASELDIWRTTPFTTLSADGAAGGTTTSNTVSINVAGVTKTYPRKIVIKQWDPNNPASNLAPQSDFVSIQITIGPRTAVIWVTQP
jgi:hypothetical protein